MQHNAACCYCSNFITLRLHFKRFVVDFQTHVDVLIDWYFCFASQSRIFHSCSWVTIAGEFLHNWGICSAPTDFVCLCVCLFLCVFVFLYRVFAPLENFSLICRRHHWRLRAANFDRYSALMAIEQWGFFSVPNLLWQGHLRGPVKLTPMYCRAFSNGAITTCFFTT